VAFTTIWPGAGGLAVAIGFAAVVVGISMGALVEVGDPLELAAWIAVVVVATAVVVGAIVPAVVEVVLSGDCVITIPGVALAFPLPSGRKTTAGATVVEVVVGGVVVGVVVVATGTTWFEFVEGATVVLEVDEVELELPDPGIVVDVEDEVELEDEEEDELDDEDDDEELELEEDEEEDDEDEEDEEDELEVVVVVNGVGAAPQGAVGVCTIDRETGVPAFMAARSFAKNGLVGIAAYAGS
jgi:hypothetical protein